MSAPAIRAPLRRSRQGRLLLGVCDGLAHQLGISATVVRLIAIVTASFGGIGVVLYIAAALLIPVEGSDHAGPLTPRTRAARLAGTIVLACMLLWGWRGPWFALPGVVLLAAVLVWLAVTRGLVRRGGLRGLWALGAALALIGLLGALVGADVVRISWGAYLAASVVVVGVVLAASAAVGGSPLLLGLGLVLLAFACLVSATDLQLAGGVGRRVYRVASILPASGRANYSLALGSLELDLRQVRPRGGRARIGASVGIGRLVLLVSSTSNVHVSGDSGVSLGLRRTVEIDEPGAVLTVDAHVAIGMFEVTHSGAVAVPAPGPGPPASVVGVAK
jgi:phage shock protein PspC (stress-responsive transcriptional regulator)